jgi:hypothetical protein
MNKGEKGMTNYENLYILSLICAFISWEQKKSTIFCMSPHTLCRKMQYHILEFSQV